MHKTAARKMRFEKFHLIGQNAFTLQIDILRVRRQKRHCHQLHTGLFRPAPSLVIIAATTGSDHIGPDIETILTGGRDMIA